MNPSKPVSYISSFTPVFVFELTGRISPKCFISVFEIFVFYFFRSLGRYRSVLTCLCWSDPSRRDASERKTDGLFVGRVYLGGVIIERCLFIGLGPRHGECYIGRYSPRDGRTSTKGYGSCERVGSVPPQMTVVKEKIVPPALRGTTDPPVTSINRFT